MTDPMPEYIPVARLARNVETGDNKVLRHTHEQYQQDMAYVEMKLAEMVAAGMDLRTEANKKLVEINKDRKLGGYPPIKEWIYGNDIHGILWVRYLLEDGSRSMLPYENDHPDMFIFEHLIMLKLLLPNPFEEAHKTTHFCEIWRYNEDAYIRRYHRWLGEIDLLTEKVEASSDDEDSVNMGGINLGKFERFLDKQDDLSRVVPETLFRAGDVYDTDGTNHTADDEDDLVGLEPEDVLLDEPVEEPAVAEEPAMEEPSDLGKCIGPSQEPSEESSGTASAGTKKVVIDEILKRPVDWVFSQFAAEEVSQTTDSSPISQKTTSSTTATSDSSNSDEDESPCKKQKTSREEEDEATIDGNGEEDNGEEDNGDEDNGEEESIPSGVEILATGSFSY
ncbi:hypothetical protein SEMRO_2348_G324310.1 [Seminavis robusta]|uniref:Uncharacterized protein n=1 Tax=Seminavis robusta TaxID=568900 RepID=A0A9N8HZQ0_9STRA|nr:hypothetical protein SEMRO_2348_G324310.1 [Seminavis robusta]|eukprot:Sro2348_g324310.1 n/a (393) ;mRNA; f:6415-7593